MNPAYREFEFDLPEALLARLIVVFEQLERGPLTKLGLEGVPDQQGVYQLFLDGQLVYIGKTDADAGLRRRLDRHAYKILHRKGLASHNVEYKAVRIYVFTAIDLEMQLIKHYSKTGGASWNKRGFGSNDPGRRRDKTEIDPRNFDALYPIDLDRELEYAFDDCATAAQAARMLKRVLPFNFRFSSETKKVAHEDLEAALIDLSGVPPTPRAILTAIVRSLPAGWQLTALRSHVILYKELVEDYPDPLLIVHSR